MLQLRDYESASIAKPPGLAMEVGSGPHRNSEPTIGALLRAERERRGWALTDVAEYLRIRRVMLDAIETGNYALLPGQVYVTAFLRTYGELLGFDGDEVIECYREEVRLAQPEPETRGLAAQLPDFSGYYTQYSDIARNWLRARWALLAPNLPEWSPRTGAYAGGGLALLLGLWLVSGSSNPPDAGRQVAQRIGGPAVETPSIRPGGVNPSPQVYYPTSNPSAAFATPAWASSPNGATMPAAAPAQPVPASVAAAPAAAASRISIRATDRTFVEVRDAAGTSIVARELRRGGTLDIPNQPGLVLTTARLNNLEFSVDGRAVASQARQGRRDVQLDPDRLLRSQAPAPRRDRPAQPQQPQRNNSQNRPQPR